jgi:NADH-quinone oxidoreductase subunit L
VAIKEFFDRAYGYTIAKIQQRLAMLLNFIEVIGLAGFLIRGGAGLVGMLGLGVRALHVGRLSAYVYWFLAGVVILWLFATGVL